MRSREAEAAAPILLVDDDPIVCSLMRAALESEGYAVVEARDGAEGCRLYEVHRPRLVIADVVMPRMDGFEMCRELRRRPEPAHLPILMVTGLDDIASIAKAYDAGATDFIAKPINWPVLTHRVRYVLRASRAFEELRQSSERLAVAKEEAEAANRVKTEFLANMSHELRTPLNAIIGFADIMRQGMFGPLSDRYAEYAVAIGESGKHLMEIINDILELSKSEADRAVLVEEEVEIARTVAFSIGTIEEMARNAGVQCRAEVPPELPKFFGNAAKLRQILINLLSNAVKFTPSGGNVRLSVETEPDSGLAFRVTDTGIGMAADKIQIALTPFGQVDSGLNRKYTGVGLGLPLAKRLIELHGGTIEIASEPGKGTAVTARFPKRAVTEKVEEPPAIGA